MVAVVLETACFVAPHETVLGRIDGGTPTAGGTAGGASGGTAGGASGGTAGGASGGTAGGASGGTAGGASGGTAGGASGGAAGGASGRPQLTVILDGGTIAPVGLTPAVCNTHGVLGRELQQRIPTDAGCGNGCLFEVVQDGGSLVYRSSLMANGELLDREVATGAGWQAAVLFQLGGQQRRLVGIPLDGGAPVTIEQLPQNSNLTVWGTWFQETLHYTLSSTNLSTGATSHALKVWNAATQAPVLTLATLPAYPRGPPIVASFAGRDLLALDDGLYVASMFSSGPLTLVHASNMVTAWTATDTGSAFFAERQGSETMLYSLSLNGAAPTPVAIGTGLDARALAAERGDEVGVLTNDGVFVVRPSLGRAQLVYTGGPFVQGYNRLEGLLVRSGLYYVGEVCYPDGDAPDWGTVELEAPAPPGSMPPNPGRARWLTGTPEWPWSTPVLDKSSAGWSPRLPVARTARGGFIVSHVGD